MPPLHPQRTWYNWFWITLSLTQIQKAFHTNVPVSENYYSKQYISWLEVWHSEFLIVNIDLVYNFKVSLLSSNISFLVYKFTLVTPGRSRVWHQASSGIQRCLSLFTSAGEMYDFSEKYCVSWIAFPPPGREPIDRENGDGRDNEWLCRAQDSQKSALALLGSLTLGKKS